MIISLFSKKKNLDPELKLWCLVWSFNMHLHIFCVLPKQACMQDIMYCQAEHIIMEAYLLYQDNQNFWSFFLKNYMLLEVLLKKYGISCVVAWLNKCLPSPGDELCIALTSHTASGWDLDGKMDSFLCSSLPLRYLGKQEGHAAWLGQMK